MYTTEINFNSISTDIQQTLTLQVTAVNYSNIRPNHPYPYSKPDFSSDAPIQRIHSLWMQPKHSHRWLEHELER